MTTSSTAASAAAAAAARLLLRPKRIILISNGSSLGNVNRTLFSMVPNHLLPLTREGALQSERAGRALKALVGDESIRFYVSPFTLTRQTFAGIQLGIPASQCIVREEPRLREQEHGNFQNVRDITSFNQSRDEYGTFYFRYPNGESGCDVYDRVSTFLESMNRDIQEENCADNFVLVTHAFVARAFLMRWFHWSVPTLENRIRDVGECELVRIELQDDRYVLVTDMERKNGGKDGDTIT